MNLEQVKQYIESEGLNGRSREQFYVFRRHYLCYRLYNSRELTLSQIGKLFNRDHSTVLHSLKKHDELKDDKLYQKLTDSCVKLLDGGFTFSVQKRDIFEDISKASNLEKLRRIRRWLNQGRYDHQKSFPQGEQNTI